MKNIFKVYCTVIVCFLLGCAVLPTQPELKNRYIYTVYIPSMDVDSLRVELEIHVHEATDSIHLLAPPIYADNPRLVPSAPNFLDLSITDCSYNNIVYNSEIMEIGLYNSLAIAIPAKGPIIRISYTVKFLYADKWSVPTPFINNKTGYIRGSYLFAIPYDNNNPDMVNIWRTPYDISVHYSLGSGISLYGDPTPTVTYTTPYQLLFSTNGINGEVLAQGRQYRFISLVDTNKMTPVLITKAKQYCETLLQDITSVFGPVCASPMSILFGINYGGGLEGMYAFSMINLDIDETKGWFPVVMAHEIIHFQVGLRVGDYEDPWWKEGTTSYLGYLFTLRNNLCTDHFINNKLLADLSTDIGVNTFALSDPLVRHYIYASEKNCESLVYDKGAQVTMLMDRKIRAVSGGSSSIDKILGEFVKTYDGKAFYRQEYMSFIKQLSGADVSDIFDKYVFTIGAIPDSVLKENCNALIGMGAFGDSITIVHGPQEISEYTPMRW